MAPIRQGDGTGVAPKGIAEVRTGGGDVLYSAGSAIPDSAVLRLKMDEGSGSTLTDSIGSNDGTINGGSWVSDQSYVGDYSVSLDGEDGYIALSSTDSRFTINESFSAAITLHRGSTGYAVVLNHTYSGSDIWGINIKDGYINAGYYDGSSYFSSASHAEPSTPYTARLVMVYNGSSVEQYLNTDPSTASNSPGLSTTTGFDIGWRRSGGDRYLNDGVDNFIMHDEALSATAVQDDYDRQPWS